MWTTPAAAVGLGPVTQQSALGQPLRVVIPLIVDGGEDLATECFKLAPAQQEADGVPQVLFGRVSLERSASGAQLVIVHPRPVNDPVVRLTVQAGCDTGVRREYTLLMDPPAIEAAELPADSSAAPAPAPTPRSAGRAPARGLDAAARDSAGTDAQPESRKAAPTKSRTAARGAARRPAGGPTPQPRLKLASPAPQASPDAVGSAASEARRAQEQQELANAIEAETVVLRQRIAELSATVERLQQELNASEIADRAAAEAAKVPPPPPPPPPRFAWWEENWPMLTLIVGLPVLIAAGLLWKRRRDSSGPDGDWPVAPATVVRPDAPTELRKASALRGAAAGVTAQRADAAPPPAKKSAPRVAPPPRPANALAVSELLHVTEEARVFVALGHPDRAMDVLNDHLKRSPRSMPAAWLMLLDLYHTNDRRQEFRRLAEDFHAQCNVQTPLWESFAASGKGDTGLEAFPHIVNQIVTLWRKPECRVYLERLLYDNREGRRTGFPLGAYGDILLLLQIGDAPPAIDIDSDLAAAGKLDLGAPTRGRIGKSSA